MRAAAVEVAAESLLVHAGGEAVVVLSGESVTATDPAFRIVRGGDHLRVRADQPLLYPFADKALPPDPDLPPFGPNEVRAATALFRLMVTSSPRAMEASAPTPSPSTARRAATRFSANS